MVTIEKIHAAVLANKDTAERLSRFIGLYSDIALSIITSNASDLLTFVVSDHPQIVLLEVSPTLPDIIELLEQIHIQYPKSQCLILAHKLDITHIRKVVDAGGLGYLLIQHNFAGLIVAIQLVCAGKFIISPQLMV